MNIWINGLSGDIDIINGLNHYIGMKHITVDMFPEFRFLPYVVGFFMLLGMIVAITGNRKFLLAYLVLTIIGGAVAMYDFYQWEYEYGHNLDPTAPINIPDLYYQPPLIGHKRLLNFDTYSFPDAGGWIVIGAGLLAFGVWFADWYRYRKADMKNKMAYAIPAIILTALLISCSAQPEPFRYGKDECYLCKMGIVDPKFGSEVITGKGKVYKFDDVLCMVRFLKTEVLKEKEIKQTVVINFEKESDFLDVKTCSFLAAEGMKSPMGGNVGAFTSKEAAEKKMNSFENSVIVSWKEVFDKIQ
jgi:copper chaperone NosL